VYEKRKKADLENLYKNLNTGKYFKSKDWNRLVMCGELIEALFAMYWSGTLEKSSQEENPINGSWID